MTPFLSPDVMRYNQSKLKESNEWNPGPLLILQFSNPGAGTIALNKKYLILN